MQTDFCPKSAQFIDTYYPIIDGVVRTVNAYAEYMNSKNYSCVITPAAKKNYTDEFSYDVFRTRSFRPPTSEYKISFPTYGLDPIDKILKNGNFDIFHAHSPFGMGKYALEAGKKLGVPVVASFHSKYYDDALQITGSKKCAEILAKYVVKFYNKVDNVWAVSNGTADTLRSYGYNGDIFVINNGTDYEYPDNPDEMRTRAREKYGIASDKPVLLFVGHQIWQKNLRVMLDACKILAGRGFDFQFLIVGKGYAGDEIQKYAEELELKDSYVKFLGQIEDKDELKSVELASKLFLFMSVYDNAPLVLREAAAMKLPALLARGSNSAENTVEGVNAFTEVPEAEKIADKIEKIFAEKEKLASVGEQAAKTIGVSWNALFPIIIDKYNEIIEKYKAEHKQ